MFFIPNFAFLFADNLTATLYVVVHRGFKKSKHKFDFQRDYHVMFFTMLNASLYGKGSLNFTNLKRT